MNASPSSLIARTKCPFSKTTMPAHNIKPDAFECPECGKVLHVKKVNEHVIIPLHLKPKE